MQHNVMQAFAAAPRIINANGRDSVQVMVSIWLVLPDSDKGRMLDRADIQRQPVDSVYHRGLFRHDNNPYRRARYYMLLSIRMAGKIGLGLNLPLHSDEKFASLIRGVDTVALDTVFDLLRLAAAYPRQSPNQDIIPHDIPSHTARATVQQIYQDMLAGQTRRSWHQCGRMMPTNSGTHAILEVTRAIRGVVDAMNLELER